MAYDYVWKEISKKNFYLAVDTLRFKKEKSVNKNIVIYTHHAKSMLKEEVIFGLRKYFCRKEIIGEVNLK